MGKQGRIRAASLLIGFALSSIAAAQWSGDPTQNLVIADRSGMKSQPKIEATPDGGCYISWFDDATGGYDVYLQRLDARGYEQWAHNGILVADRSFSSTEDYGLDVDTAGNAVLAFRDDRGGPVRITAAKISPDGTHLWGADGIWLSGKNDAVLSPRITATSDGGCVAGWTKISPPLESGARGEVATVELQKLDAEGATLWGTGVSLADSEGYHFMLSDIQTGDAGGAIVSWVRQGATLYPRHLWAQKFSSTGEALWDPSHVVVFDGESLQAGNFPTFIPDGSGGAVFCWYFITYVRTDCAAQRILADGSEWFPHDGVTTSTSPRNRAYPSVSFNPVTEEIFVFWQEQSLGQAPSQCAVYGQKLAFERSVRQWTDEGKLVSAFSPGEKGPIGNLLCGDGALACFNDALDSDEGIHTVRLDTNGDPVWSPPALFTGSTYAWRLDAVLSSNDVALLAWTDGAEVYGQNVNRHGTLGLVPGDLDANGCVDQADLGILLADWGCTGGDCPGDCDGDGNTDQVDLGILLAHWGEGCP